MKIQWGTDTTNTNTSQSSMKKITYLLTGGFTVSPAIFASQRYDESGASCILQTFNVTATTFQINAKHATTNQYYARNFSWMAIGY